MHQQDEPPFRVFIRTLDHHELPMMVEPTQSLKELKTRIEADAGTPVAKQQLLYHGCLLTDDYQSLHDAHITKDALLQLVPPSVDTNDATAPRRGAMWLKLKRQLPGLTPPRFVW